MKNLIPYLFLLFFSIKTHAQVSADFTVNKTSGCAPFLAEFTDFSLDANSWKWDFGNGVTSELQNPTCVYLEPGVYTVTLIAYNSSESDTITKSTLIQINASPIASFTYNIPICSDHFQVNFNNISSGSGLTYSWDFGDGTLGYTIDAFHIYNTPPEQFLVKLYAENVLGCVDSTERYVKAPFTIARFYEENDIYTGPVPLDVTFKDTSYTSDANITSVIWDFGDPASGALNISTETSPSHTYTTPGDYDITYIIFTDNGCSDTVVFEAAIKADNPLTSFAELVNNSICCDKELKIESLFPNPSYGEVNMLITSKEKRLVKLTVYDSVGKILKSEEIQINEGDNQISNIINGASGKYFISVVTSDGKYYDYDVVLIK